MPTYAYDCRACGVELEVVQGIRDRKLKKCPRCGERTLLRRIGPGGGLVFRGPGFHCNDYPNQPRPSEGTGTGK